MTDNKAHWEKIYANNSPFEVSWHQQQPVISLQLIHQSQISHNDAIIDVGGGASTLVDNLCSEGYNNISVLDISANALAHAKSRLGKKAATIEWYEQDITCFNPPHSFSLWHDRAVFHFLTNKSDRENYIHILKTSLKPQGHLIIAAFSLDGPSMCSGLEIVQYDSKKLKSELGKEFHLLAEQNERHITPNKKEQRFVYFHFIKT